MKEFAKKFKASLPGYLMVMPLYIGLIIFAFYPPIYGFLLSLFKTNPGESKTIFCGFDNYVRLFNDKIFLNSIPTMLILMIPKLIISIIIPFIVAEMIFSVKSKKLQETYRFLLLLPMLAPGVVGTLIWKSVYDPDGGLLTAILRLFSIIEKNAKIDWLGDSRYVIFSIIFLGFPWIGGTNVLIYLAGLYNIPKDVIESATLDGASIIRRIFAIDLPYLFGQIRFFLIFGIINGLQDYSIQILLTNGGPGYSSYVPGYYMYHQAFMYNNKYYASAIGFAISIIILVFTVATNLISKRREKKIEV
ncbi:MAG: carbohydrate ABC transporter permease [Bacilli bacterium]|jgi:ABC-type sugar transport system permease subunit